MSEFSFRNIKFFKKSPAPKKPNANNSIPDKDKKVPLLERQAIHPHLLLLVFVIAVAYLISYVPTMSLPQLSEGEIAPADIIAPADLTIEDKETTENRRKAAEEAVPPAYNLDRNAFLITEEKIREFFSSGREFSQGPLTAKQIDEFNSVVFEKYGFKIPTTDLRLLTRMKFPADLEENLIGLIGKISSAGIILTKNLFIHGEQEKGLTLITSPGNERSINTSEIQDINESKVKLSEEINVLELSSNEKALLIVLSHLFVSENISFNPMETNARQKAARQDVDPFFYTIKKGKVIIRKGDEVSQEVLKQVKIINQNLTAKPSWLINFFGSFILFGLLFLALLYYLRVRFEPSEALQKFILLGSTLILSLFIYKGSLFLANLFSQNVRISLFERVESYNFAFPFQMGVLLICYLTGTHIALIFTVLNSILVGYFLKSNFYLLLFSLFGGFSAILGIKYFGKRILTPVLRAAIFLVIPINLLMIITFRLIQGNIGTFGIFTSELLMGFLGGLLSGAIAFLLLPVFENLSGIITPSKLLELSNSDLPIFRQMAIEAPGSYHHSLIVASLTESAAEELGLDPLLAKAGALYHDIGKIKRPEYFIENRRRYADMHKDLKPSMSYLVIVNHVKEGLEQANKLRLPKKIKGIIAQHHGNSLVRYFFEKAKEEYNPDMQTIGEESYRYAGPRPKTKEAALVMLADSVEAASRSLKNPIKATLNKLINDIFNNYLQDGQLDDCDFSLKELKTTAASFLSTLYTVYHPRVEYPGFNFEGKKKSIEKSKNANDRSPKPAK